MNCKKVEQPKVEEKKTPKQEKKFKDVKVVIDPGHGYQGGTTGAAASIYTYKVRGDNGKPELDANKKLKTKTGDVLNLPAYVLNEPDVWVVSKKEDHKHNERNLVFDVSIKLKALLEKQGITCYLTRNSQVLTGKDDAKSRADRVELANKNKANYFISIHADGSENSKSTGSHVIYPKTTDLVISNNCKELATDIFKYYNVVNVEKLSPKEDSRGLQVLKSDNLTPRKVLVELGFVTNPKDANALFLNVDRIAAQLSQGILLNAEKYFSDTKPKSK